MESQGGWGLLRELTVSSLNKVEMVKLTLLSFLRLQYRAFALGSSHSVYLRSLRFVADSVSRALCSLLPPNHLLPRPSSRIPTRRLQDPRMRSSISRSWLHGDGGKSPLSFPSLRVRAPRTRPPIELTHVDLFLSLPSLSVRRLPRNLLHLPPIPRNHSTSLPNPSSHPTPRLRNLKLHRRPPQTGHVLLDQVEA